MEKVIFRGNVPTYIATKAEVVIKERQQNVLNGHSKKWKKIGRLKGVFSFPLGANFRILQISTEFEVMPHKLYDRQINGRL
jgi:hypothetical protein